MHVSVYALCHVGNITVLNIYIFVYCFTVYGIHLRRWYMWQCGMLPFFTSERNPGVLSINCVADAVKCEELCVQTVSSNKVVQRNKKLLLSLAGIYEIMYRSKCISFLGMEEFTWILNIYLFTLNAIMLFNENGKNICGFLGDLSDTKMLIRLLHFDKILHVSHLKSNIFSINFLPNSHISIHFYQFMWFWVHVFCIRMMIMSGLLQIYCHDKGLY